MRREKSMRESEEEEGGVGGMEIRDNEWMRRIM